ncbi:splicing factor PWI domain-containing protein isoform X1 [Iris pallida]|uniref:Splicing factor PWI domain-containing protein isoform X1 n=1 Tax=Iris pallida TaxID=29817 RepID=A0AAX6E676_IRIPA|nr:splicing factor PWI domain-containing protein isoform X1 [Iris pallida]
MESRIFRELFWWCWDYFGGFLWTIFGWKIFAGICWRTSQFWVCPEIEEVLPNFLQKLYFIDFKLAFENEFPKPIFGRRPYRSVGPGEMQTYRSDRTLRHKPNFEEMDRV